MTFVMHMLAHTPLYVFVLLVTHRLRRPAMDETGAELIISGTAPSAQRSGFAWCEKPVC